MCCGDCSPIFCAAVPETDWSAYTWRWRSPEAAPFAFRTVLETGAPDPVQVDHTRQFLETDLSMIHPGECPCLWLVPVRDELTNLFNGGRWQSPAIGSLQRLGQTWSLSITRWHYASGSPWWLEGWYKDWSFEPNFVGDCGYRFGGYAGYSPYGWHGYGWSYGWAYGWGYWGASYGLQALYTLQESRLKSDGSDNVFSLNQFRVNTDNPDNGWDNAAFWPSTVTLSRIPKSGALS